MSYFHVVVKIKANQEPLCIFKDLSKSELQKCFVKPYKLGKNLFYDGHILPTTELSKIKIISTLKRHKEELKVVQEESYKKVQEFNNSDSGATLVSPGYGYDDYEIEDCGTEVTKDFIESAPGEGTFSSKSSEFIRHPWVVRVFAGMLFTLAIIYFGLK